MRYLIQIFRTSVSTESVTIGSWSNTAWGGDNLDTVLDHAKSVKEHLGTGVLTDVSKVRVVQVLWSSDNEG